MGQYRRRKMLFPELLPARLPPGRGGSGCATPGGTDQTSVATSGPANVKVLIFNNPIFTAVQNDMVATLGQIDPQVKVDYTLFPGQINDFRTKMVAMYVGGDIPDAQWVHTTITSLVGGKKLLSR